MKYIVVLGDGMADEPIEALGGKTPLAYADTKMMDQLSKKGEVGMVHTIPDGMKPGSDTANLSVLGYDPKRYYSGRSPLEALSIGVPMKETDIAIRCNIVTISEEEEAFEDKIIIDHSSDEISTEDCAVLLRAVQEALQNETYQFYVGTSYRHCLIWNRGTVVELTPPHDVLGQRIGQYLPGDAALRRMMEVSYGILKDHPLNVERKKKGLNPANCCWFWGAGTRPSLSSFEGKYHKKGAMISAVDLLKGIAVGTGMTNICVEGANGGLHTNYEGKAQAAADALLKDGFDFVYVHVEAPDEMGHQGSLEKKVRAIWTVDIIRQALDNCSDGKLFIAINLAFACSLRMGEITGLTWDCVHITDQDIAKDDAYIIVNKELARVDQKAIAALGEKDILFMFPRMIKGKSTTRLVLKKPKTETSIRKIWLPKTLAYILRDWKERQEKLKEFMGDEYVDYNLVLALETGRPCEDSVIGNQFERLKKSAGLPDVVFHSLRHSSTTYKLKLNHGDIKATQGDTGHAQAQMVTEVYAHILDEERKINAQKFEAAFYANPDMHKVEQGLRQPETDQGADLQKLLTQL